MKFIFVLFLFLVFASARKYKGLPPGYTIDDNFGLPSKRIQALYRSVSSPSPNANETTR